MPRGRQGLRNTRDAAAAGVEHGAVFAPAAGMAAGAILLALVACGPAPTPPPPEARLGNAVPTASATPLAHSVAELEAALAQRGVAFTGEGQQQLEFLEAPAWIYRRGEDSLEVHEFPTDEEASEAVARFSADGHVIGQADGSRTAVDWLGSPHVFAGGRLLVIYVGTDRQVLSVLEDIFGPQRAGTRP